MTKYIFLCSFWLCDTSSIVWLRPYIWRALLSLNIVNVFAKATLNIISKLYSEL